MEDQDLPPSTDSISGTWRRLCWWSSSKRWRDQDLPALHRQYLRYPVASLLVE